jgi:hypothetical protein
MGGEWLGAGDLPCDAKPGLKFEQENTRVSSNLKDRWIDKEITSS